MGSIQVLPIRVRVDLGVMVMKGYSKFPKTPRLASHYEMQFSVKTRALSSRTITSACGLILLGKVIEPP